MPWLFDLEFRQLVLREDSAGDLENISNVECLSHGLLWVPGDEARERGGTVVRVEAHSEQGVALRPGRRRGAYYARGTAGSNK